MNPMQQLFIHIPTRELIHSPARRNDMHITDFNILAHIRTTTNHISTDRIKDFTRRPSEILHRNVADRQVRRILIAQRQVVLPVALGDFNRVVHIRDNIVAVSDILHTARSSAALEVSGEFSG